MPRIEICLYPLNTKKGHTRTIVSSLLRVAILLHRCRHLVCVASMFAYLAMSDIFLFLTVSISPFYICPDVDHDKFCTVVNSNRYKRRNARWRGTVVSKISCKMKVLLGFVVLGTFLVSCLATCSPGLNNRDNFYQCDGLDQLNVRNCLLFIFFTEEFVQSWPTLL